MGICSVMKRWSNERKGWCTKTGRRKGWVTAAIYLDLFHRVTQFSFIVQHRADRKSLFTFTLSIPLLISLTVMLRYYNTYTYGKHRSWWHQCCIGWLLSMECLQISYGSDRPDGSHRLLGIRLLSKLRGKRNLDHEDDELIDIHHLNCEYHPDFLQSCYYVKLKVTEYRRKYYFFNRLVQLRRDHYYKVEVEPCNDIKMPLQCLIVRYGRSCDEAVQTYFQTLYLLQSR